MGTAKQFGKELWYGTLDEINVIVKSMIKRLQEEF